MELFFLSWTCHSSKLTSPSQLPHPLPSHPGQKSCSVRGGWRHRLRCQTHLSPSTEPPLTLGVAWEKSLISQVCALVCERGRWYLPCRVCIGFSKMLYVKDLAPDLWLWKHLIPGHCLLLGLIPNSPPVSKTSEVQLCHFSWIGPIFSFPSRVSEFRQPCVTVVGDWVVSSPLVLSHPTAFSTWLPG